VFKTIAEVSLLLIEVEHVPQFWAFKPLKVNKKKKAIKENPILFINIIFRRIKRIKAYSTIAKRLIDE
jgi:hypothetical protein